MENINWLESWYKSKCNGDWEHFYGVEIGSLDNPGWFIKIDLTETPLFHRSKFEYQIEKGENDWIRCWTENGCFHGCGDPLKLNRLIEIFKNWVQDEIIK